uniref:RPAP1_N domain-containing protein n=1 Tax=Angiostrongylus cantonensis TaxID=6313 RepID=A0A0K0DJW7_ANGCA
LLSAKSSRKLLYRYLESLDEEKINELRQEIAEKLAPDKIDFLKHRYQMKKETTEAKPKVSKYKASRESKFEPHQPSSLVSSTVPSTTVLKDIVDHLEVLDEFGDRSDEEKYNRIAADAVQLDFATKCMRMVVSRQQKNAVKLFDNCKTAPSGCTDELLQQARSRIDDIKKLYLEEIKCGERTYFQFANELNPVVDGSWMLVPVRRVLDSVHKREALGNTEICEDDVEIVRLALLWTVLLHDERPTVFSFANPNDIYVRLGEVLIIGESWLQQLLFFAAVSGRLCLRMGSRIAGLDAFMPFFEDLLIHFEQYSLGNVGFARTLLIGAYLNAAVTDSMECRFALWSPKRSTARQMTIKIEDAVRYHVYTKSIATLLRRRCCLNVF